MTRLLILFSACLAGVACRKVGPLRPTRMAVSLAPNRDLLLSAANFKGNGVSTMVLGLRGGADDKKKSGNSISNSLSNITPTTRTWLLGCLVMAALTMAGVPEELFLFEWRRTFLNGQLWRPFTSACHLGKVDMGMASQVFFLVSYGQEMERQDGPAQHGMFLMVQTLLLMVLSALTGFPSLARSLITASIYCCSRRQPMRPMEVQFGVRIEYWLLPYVNMVIDCLQAQSAAGAVPHVLGIATGHVYHFFSVVWPAMGGRRYVAAPGMLKAVYEAKTTDGKKKKTKERKGETQGNSEKKTEKGAAKTGKSNQAGVKKSKKKK